MRRIDAGELDKVVLARDVVVTASAPIDPRHLLTRLAARYPSCWTFMVDGLVGATPEMLVRRTGDDVTSRVLAGTMRRSSDASSDASLASALLDSAKDHAEHEYAVSSVAAALAAHCTDLDVPETPRLLRLANVQHLATDVHVRADDFWLPAGQRFEYGREDEESWLNGWLDEGSLRREVLDSFPDTGRALPALRDPRTDRSARVAVLSLPADGVVVVSGSVLLGRGLPFDVRVHLRLTPAALVRRTPDDQAWTLPALGRYVNERKPLDEADLVVRYDDPRHPALVERD